VPRIAGVDLPADKRIDIALTYIFGIGRTTAREILDKTGVDPNVRTKNLSEEDTAKLRGIIESDIKVEGALRSEVSTNVKRLMDIGCYRGLRHRRGLPARGQRTHTNARTRKGPKKGVMTRKKKEVRP
jgi:small subunit ribosomal protein S13